MKRLRIALDMDDVFADASGALIDKYNDNHGTHFTLEQMKGGGFDTFFDTDQTEEIRSYLYEPGFFRNLKVIKDASEVLPLLVQKHDVFVVSAAQQFPYSLTEKSEWLDEYFPMISWHNRVFCGDKHIISADVLIDDHAYNLDTFRGETYLFTCFHNKHLTKYSRIDDWEKIRTIFCS